MAKKFNLKSKITSKLRGIYQYYPERREALKRNRVGKDHYLCDLCQKVFVREAVQIDHIHPVVGRGGFKDWNTYIDRLFCGIDNLQVACMTCHKEKTNRERTLRDKK